MMGKHYALGIKLMEYIKYLGSILIKLDVFYFFTGKRVNLA